MQRDGGRKKSDKIISCKGLRTADSKQYSDTSPFSIPWSHYPPSYFLSFSLRSVPLFHKLIQTHSLSPSLPKSFPFRSFTRDNFIGFLSASISLHPKLLSIALRSAPLNLDRFHGAEYKIDFTERSTSRCRKSCLSLQGILRGEVSLYHWPPVWLVWI